MSRRRRPPRPTSSGPTILRDYQRLENAFPVKEVFSADEVAKIHDTALRVLDELGIRILLPEAREILARAGARVDEDNQMVFLDRGMVEENLKEAPSAFTIYGQTPQYDIDLHQKSLIFVAGAGCPNITDLDHGRRAGTLEDFETTTKLQQTFGIIGKLSPSIEPQEVPLNIRHLETTKSQLALSDKIPFVWARGTGQVEDSFRILALAAGVSEEEFKAKARTFTVINTNSPRQIDVPMAQGIIDMARWGQPSVITPFCLAGAMAPITTAGALTLSHAEALAGITLAQIVNPSAPVVYGAFSSNVDMKSGAPVFGTPEHQKANFGSGQLARHIGVPWRSASGSAANIADAQAAHETQLGLWGTVLAGANFVYHAAGWLEGGLTFSMEKFITDVEALQIIAESMEPIGTSADEIGFDAIAEVEPGGHFFAAKQTMERFKDAFYEPLVCDWSNFGQWTDNGSIDASARANTIWKQVIADFQPPAESTSRLGAIEQFIAKRKEEGGALPPD